MSQPGYSKFYKQPSQDMIDSIIFASQGDIRSAVLNLHFASQKGAPSLETVLMATANSANSSTSSKTKGKSKSKNMKLKTIGRDANITLMHALGRVFNPKCKFLFCFCGM